MSYFINPGGANQISSFRCEELPRNWRPEAEGDKSSPESGVCLRLLKTWRDLSPSYLSCLVDRLSFGASRWPFVSDDLLILFSPPLPWLFISLLVAVVLPSSSPGEKEERTAAASRDSGKKSPKTKEWMARLGSTLEGLTCFLLSLVNTGFYTRSPWWCPHSQFYRLHKTEVEKSYTNHDRPKFQHIWNLETWWVKNWKWAQFNKYLASMCSSYLEAHAVWLFSLKDKMTKQ